MPRRTQLMYGDGADLLIASPAQLRRWQRGHRLPRTAAPGNSSPPESDASGPGFSESDDELRCAVAEAQEMAEWRAAVESVVAASAGGVFDDGADREASGSRDQIQLGALIVPIAMRIMVWAGASAVRPAACACC
jgi:hypothetical protein